MFKLCSLTWPIVLMAAFVGGPDPASACTAKHSFSTVEAGFITNAAVLYAPYSMIDDAGNMTGIDGEILQAIAELECLKVKAVPVDASAAIQYVVSKRSDTTSADWSRTAERLRVVNLSAPLYVDQMAVYSKAGWSSAADLDGKSVGSLQGQLWNGDAKKVFGDRLKFYPTSVAMLQDLMEGRIDAGLESAATGVIAQKQGGLQGIKIVAMQADARIAASKEPTQGCFPMTKSNAEMARAFDDDIKQLHENGTIDHLLVKYGLSASASRTGAPRLIQ